MNERKIKLFATDLDGTLFSNFGTLSDYAKDVLIKARKQGMKIVISSGRPYYSIQRTIPDECYDYASCMNGQVIVDRINDKTISKRDLSEEEIQHLSSFIRKFPVVMACSLQHQFVHYCSRRQAYKYRFYEFGRWVLSKLRRTQFYHEELRTNVSELSGQQIGKICFSGTPAVLKKICDELEQHHYSYFMVSPVWLEVQPENISKGHALKEIMEMEHLESEDCAAIGDGENDIPMFRVVGTSIAMKNAMKSVKEEATDQADSFLNDGCAKWLDRYLQQNI